MANWYKTPSCSRDSNQRQKKKKQWLKAKEKKLNEHLNMQSSGARILNGIQPHIKSWLTKMFRHLCLVTVFLFSVLSGTNFLSLSTALRTSDKKPWPWNSLATVLWLCWTLAPFPVFSLILMQQVQVEQDMTVRGNVANNNESSYSESQDHLLISISGDKWYYLLQITLTMGQGLSLHGGKEKAPGFSTHCQSVFLN